MLNMKSTKLNNRNRQKLPKQWTDAPPPAPLRLNLGAGNSIKEGFISVDSILFPNVQVVTDLHLRWPWADSTVEEAFSSHCLEHFDGMERVHFINELYRVLRPGAKATIIAPHWSSCRAYGDPTHRWPPVSEFAFFYWKRDWRMANAPHTDISRLPDGFDCNFDVTWGYSLEPGVAARNQEYQQHAMTYWKEACQDCIATLTKIA